MRPRARRLRRRLFLGLALLLGLHLLLILPWRWVDPPSTAFMLREPGPVDWRPVPLGAVSRWAGLAVVAAEDQRFPSHWGIDLRAIADALEDNAQRQRPRGASTLTQQLIKNMVFSSRASYTRKAAEAWLALWAELLWPKRRILELYLNVAEFGPGIYGIEAAARHYFGRSAAALTPAQAARLAAVMPSPKRLSPLAGGYVSERAAWIEQQMQQLGGPRYLAPILQNP